MEKLANLIEKIIDDIIEGITRKYDITINYNKYYNSNDNFINKYKQIIRYNKHQTIIQVYKNKITSPPYLVSKRNP